MAQISKRPLTKDIEMRVLYTLWDALAYLKNEADTKKFLEDLLTPTEKVMLSKRLAIAVLLTKNYDYKSIKQILKVSSGTINNIAKWMKISGSGFKMTINHLLKEQKWIRVLDMINEVLHETLPNPKGKRIFNPRGPRKPIVSKSI